MSHATRGEYTITTGHAQDLEAIHGFLTTGAGSLLAAVALWLLPFRAESAVAV
jgi:hypothetical protein